jgi:hypothetical protein
MPIVSQAQRGLMWWAKKNPKAAAKRGIKAAVAKEFTESDPGGSLPAKVKDGKPARKWYGKAKED